MGGDDGVSVGRITGKLENEGWGLKCRPSETPSAMGFGLYLEQWSEVPALTIASVATGTDTMQLYMVFDWPEGGGWDTVAQGSVVNVKASGWAVHTDDLGDANDSMFMWRFAGSFVEEDIANPGDDDGLFIVGNAKGYDVN
ncbi:MAG: hypothetical protein JXR76_28735 [Deltaproteobacteria bacterium]|nr:hypothetical protein [Deltaproteobacteria bacterium]